jgi:hypothetical protein
METVYFLGGKNRPLDHLGPILVDKANDLGFRSGDQVHFQKLLIGE